MKKVTLFILGLLALVPIAFGADSVEATETQWFVHLTYILATAGFILALKFMSHPKTAREGVLVGEIGMLLAIVGTLISHQVISYTWVMIALFIGAAVGVPLAVFMPMTAVPQRTAISHAFGAIAAALVGSAHYMLTMNTISRFDMIALVFEMLLGFLTFTGSLMAFGKLQEILPSNPTTFKGQNFFNLSILGIAIGAGAYMVYDPTAMWVFPIFIFLSLLFGVLLIMPIGGADMPTVIALLNSYAGLSASLMGFVLNNKLLIVAGALDGSSGLILSIVMCKAMNRSFTNVLFGAFGATTSAKADDVYGSKIKSVTAEDIAMMLEGAQRVVVIPGYGMAVAQAQFAIRDLANLLEGRGAVMEYAIHPVAGRMPGHMNVLLAEANIPYDKLIEMEEINPTMGEVDVAIVIGANDTVNPIARSDPNSPIAGMPIIDADKAKNVIVVKRSLSPGFAGIPNPLFAAPNAVMFFADGKKAVLDIIAAVKAA